MNEKKTAEDLRLYGISYTRIHSDGRRERIPPMEIMVKKINEAQQTAALREENERLKEAVKESLPIVESYRSNILLFTQYSPENVTVLEELDSLIENTRKLIQE